MWKPLRIVQEQSARIRSVTTGGAATPATTATAQPASLVTGPSPIFIVAVAAAALGGWYLLSRKGG